MLASQSYTLSLLQPPELQPPLHPPEPPSEVLQPLPVEHPLHPIYRTLSGEFVKQLYMLNTPKEV